MPIAKSEYLKNELKPSVKWTEHGLLTLTRFWEIDSEAIRTENIRDKLFIDRETPDDEYTNALLVDQDVRNGSDFGVTQVYYRVYQELPEDNETLVQLGEDIPNFSDNGLKTVEQRFVCRSGHSLTGVVGTTIGATGEINGLYLSSNAFAERGKVSAIVVKRWAEAGELDLTTSYDLDGLESLAYTFIGTIGTTSGRIVYNKTGNLNGFRTYIVKTLRKIGGGTVVDNEVVHSQQVRVNFTYPGVANFTTRIIPLGGYNGFTYYWGKVSLERPSTVPITATMEIRYQNDGDVGTMPDNPADPGNPIPYWAPESWASLSADWVSRGVEPTSVDQAFEGYRVGAVNQLTYTGGFDKASFLGRFVYGNAIATLSGGPEDPEGNYYVLNNPTPEPAFVDESGTKWYRRTVIYAQIPTRT